MEVMELNSSTYYKEKSASSAEKEEIEADILGQIESVRVEFPRAGYRTLMEYLKRRGMVVIDALKMAYERRENPAEVIHYSDRGVHPKSLNL